MGDATPGPAPGPGNEAGAPERVHAEGAADSPLSPRRFAALNAVVSVAAIAFLFWLIYFHEGPPPGAYSPVLPSFNALFNAISALFLFFGRRAILAGNRQLHKNLMLGAVVSSALFLVTYVYYHHTQGDTPFAGTGWVRPIFFAILISHIVLSVVTLPMILTSLYLGLSDRIAAHKRLSRWTWRFWMYVCVTGLLVYLNIHVIDWS